MSRRRVTTTSSQQSTDPPVAMDVAAEPLIPSANPSHTSYNTLNDSTSDQSKDQTTMISWSSWLIYAVASGACAAFNGVFAKLTTTELTTTIASHVATSFHLSPGNHAVEYLIRATFFALNLIFNAIMWFLFTRALTLHSSTTRVSIINTSSNFMLTAFLGLLIFSEKLPPLWWVGAGMLVIGNVIIGRNVTKDDGNGKGGGQVREGSDVEDGLLEGMAGEGEDAAGEREDVALKYQVGEDEEPVELK